MTPWLHIPHQILRPQAKQLKQFALAQPLAVGLICWWTSVAWLPALVALSVGILVAIIGWYRPVVLTPLFVIMSLVALPIGWIVGELVLLVVYFGMVTPIALMFRMLGRDALERPIDRSTPSYWRAKPRAQSPKSYLRRW